MFTDSHAHLTSDQLFPDLEEILERAAKQKLDLIVNICTDSSTLERGLAVKTDKLEILQSAACTPHDVESIGESFLPLVEKAAQEGLLAAIGETGLDYYYEHSERDLQKSFFIKHIELAKRFDLPLVIHCREAFADFFKIIDEYYPHRSGVLHCFTGSLEEAKEVLARGWFLSLSGIVSFKKSDSLREVAKLVPLEQILLETDSPYLAPQSKRGKRCEPAFIEETYACIAQAKDIPITKLAEAVKKNCQRLFMKQK